MNSRYYSFLILIALCFISPLSFPETYSAQNEEEELNLILNNCADYCDKLMNSILYFICDEKIIEEIHQPPIVARMSKDLPTERMESQIRIPSKLLENNEYVYDYQLIRKNKEIEEVRILIKENGKEKQEKGAKLKTRVFKYKNVIFGPIGLFSHSAQQIHDYRIIDHKEFNDDKVFVVEVRPIQKGNERNLFGKAWISKNDYSILKIEWEQESIGNYDRILKMAERLRATPKIKSTSEYAFQKNGIRFPSKYFIEEIYLIRKGKSFTRSKTEIIYQDYKFFIVETEVR